MLHTRLSRLASAILFVIGLAVVSSAYAHTSGIDAMRQRMEVRRAVRAVEHTEQGVFRLQIEREPRVTQETLYDTGLVKRPAPPLRQASGGVNWNALARCESTNNWAESSGYYEGGVQLSPENWDTHKPPGAPEAAYMATRDQQIHAAEGVLAEEGRGAWPPLSRAECN